MVRVAATPFYFFTLYTTLLPLRRHFYSCFIYYTPHHSGWWCVQPRRHFTTLATGTLPHAFSAKAPRDNLWSCTCATGPRTAARWGQVYCIYVQVCMCLYMYLSAAYWGLRSRDVCIHIYIYIYIYITSTCDVTLNMYKSTRDVMYIDTANCR